MSIGAQPRIWAAKETNRPDFHHTFDVMGAGPRMLHFELNKPEFNLTNADIGGSQPCVNQFKSTRTNDPSNPLNPVYKLQSFDYVKPDANKFVRDQMVIDDIKGTRSKPPTNKPVRDIMNIKDIEGTQNRQRTNTRATSYSNIDYRDVTNKHWETKRSNNPLMPEYSVRDTISDGDFMKITNTSLNKTYGKIDGNNPCALPAPVSGTRNLETQDVKGAQADTKRLGSFTHYSRRADQVRPVGRNDDVDGSKCGSVLKGIVTVRQTNPLMPNYQIPGHSVDGSGKDINNPYGNQGKRRDAPVTKSVNW